MKTYRYLPVIVLLLVVFTGCSSLLPRTTTTVRSPWEHFDNAKSNYDKIKPGETTVDDLKKLGFDPYAVPNIKIMNVTEVINLFLPNPSINKSDLDPGIQKCIASKDRCTAFQVSPSTLHVKRIGNFWLDMFVFKRHSETTGWEFRGVITMVDNVVTYRDPPGGRPLIYTEQVDIKPLGPLQEIGTILISEVPKLMP